MQIIEEDGVVCTSAECCAHALRKYWLDFAKPALVNFICVWPDDLTYEVSFDHFGLLLDSLLDSGVGIDYFPTSCWRFAPDAFNKCLYDCYLFIMDHKVPDDTMDTFLSARMVCIQKGNDPNDGDSRFFRKLGKTRPLVLSNTDQEIISKTAAIPLNLLCQRVICSQQRAGITGRQMIKHLAVMEGKVIDFILRHHPHSGVIALDVKAAFPSMSRRYLFWILRMMKFLKRFYRLLKTLHRASLVYICFRGRLWEAFLCSTGVKQVDPCAMLLFILGYDSLIKLMASTMGPRCETQLAYCDDVAITSFDIRATWRQLVKIFKLITLTSSLEMNADKTQSYCTNKQQLPCILDSMILEHEGLHHSQFQLFLKYLGLFVGHDTWEMNWDSPLSGFIETAKFIQTLQCGFSTQIALYNMLCVSKLSFIGKLFLPTARVLRAEAWATQLIQCGPWNAIPSTMMANHKSLGFPFETRLVSVSSAAAMTRCACVTFNGYRTIVDTLEDTLNSDDISLEVLSKGFNASFLWKWKEFVSKYCSKLDHDGHERPWTPKLFRQKSIAHSIKSELPFDSDAVIQRRLSTFFKGGSFEHRIHQFPLVYKHYFTLLGPKLISCHLRTICNQWCSRRCFDGRIGKCVFQCVGLGSGDDDIDHSITCPLFSELAVKKLRLHDELISLEPLLLLSL